MDRGKIERIIQFANTNKISLPRQFKKIENSKGYASIGCEEMADKIYWGMSRIFEGAFSSGMSAEKINDVQELAKIWGKLSDPKIISKLAGLNNKVGGIMSKYNNIERSEIKEAVIKNIDSIIIGTNAIKNKKTKTSDIEVLEEAIVLLRSLKGIVIDVLDGKSKEANDYAKKIVGDKNQGLLGWWESTKNDMFSKTNNLKLNDIMQTAVSWWQLKDLPKKRNYAKDSDIVEYDPGHFELEIDLDKVEEEANRFFEVLRERKESLDHVDQLEQECIDIRGEIENLEREIDLIDEKIDYKEISLEAGDLEISVLERKIDEKLSSLSNNEIAIGLIGAEVTHLRDIIEKYSLLENFYKTYKVTNKELFYELFSTLPFNSFLNALKPLANPEDIAAVSIRLDAILNLIEERVATLESMGERLKGTLKDHPVQQKVATARREREDDRRKEAEIRKKEREEKRRHRAGITEAQESKTEAVEEEKLKVRLGQMTNEESRKPESFLNKNANEKNINNGSQELSSAEKLEENLKKKIKLKEGYNAPPTSLLDTYDDELEPTLEDFEFMKDKIDKIMVEFDVPAEVISAKRGPTFTRYELTLGEGYKVNRLSSLIDNFKMRLEVKQLRILTPIGGRNALGLEIPNEKRLIVGIKSIIESERFSRQTDGIDLCFGLTNDGEKYIADLSKMPHMLVAGATGTGKSVFLKSILIGLIYKYSPEDLRLILVDPKRVDLSRYRNLPHLLVPDTIKEYQEAVDVFYVLVKEMEDRYKILENAGCSNIAEYNQQHPDKKMYRIVLVVDEMADLIMRARGSTEFEDSIIRLAQLARASGIHMILATQRPVAEFITGSIKSNIVSRVAFKVQSGRESSIILDETGAEELLGFGDMLFSSPSSGLVRMQGAFVDSKEITDVCDYVKKNNIIVVEDDVESPKGFDNEIADIDDITR